MTSTAATRPFVVATILFGTADADAVRALLEAAAPDQGVSFLLLMNEEATGAKNDELRARVTGTTRLDTGLMLRNSVVDLNAAYFVSRKQVQALRDNTVHFTSETEAAADNVGSFLSSVAEDQGRRGCVIVFAGAIDDEIAAADGMRRIAEQGGLVLAQSEAGGPFRRIMRSAEKTEPLVTLVSVAELPGVLFEHAEPLVAEERPRTASAFYTDVETVLPALCEALRESTGHDFGQYKSSTLIRRTLRRMHLLRMQSATAYLERVSADRTEADCLFNDLLVSVTAFFRDIDAFKSLAATVVPRILGSRTANEAVRIWVAGCATGEEAYSLAMLFREGAENINATNRIRIFATDLDEHALSVARRGRYPASRLAHVSPERIEKFFTRTGTSFQVTKEIRDLVLFARHNVINDPPFSNVDLVSCRNVLIYLGDELHQRILPLFHYALRPNGFLFLGPAESLTTHQDMFQPVDIKHRISRRIGSSRRMPPPMNVRRDPRPHITAASVARGESEILRVMQQHLSDEFAPKGLVVNDEGQVVAASDNLEAYLTVSAGPFVNSVTRLVRDGLRIAVRSALREAIALGKRVVHHGGTLESTDGWQRVTVSVQPMEVTASTAGLLLIVFQPIGQPVKGVATNGSSAAAAVVDRAESKSSLALIERLEFDLASTRAELYGTVQDLEASNEELKSSNEELLSMNEELQSSNEELESSKDELQEANDLLESTNSDLTNLLISTQIPTVFLDYCGNVRRVTPTASAIYNLFPTDVGRPLHHFTHKAEFMPPLPDLDVLRRAERAIESDVRMLDGTIYVRRVLPYLTTDGELDGIVVTFIDVTETRRHSAATIESEQRFRHLAETIPQLTWMARADGHVFWYNQRWYDYTGKTLENMQGWGWADVHDPDLLPVAMERWRRALATGDPFEMILPLRGHDGQYRPFLSRINPFRDESGAITLWFGTHADLSQERANAEALRRHQRELQVLADNSPDVLTRFDRNLRHVFVNAAIEQATGLPASAFIGKTHREMGIPEVHAIAWETCIRRVFQSREREQVDFAYETPTGMRYYSGILVPESDEQGRVEFVLSFTRDCTRERIAEKELRDASRQKDQFLATLAHELRNPLAPIRNGIEILKLLPNVDSTVASVRDMMERQVTSMSRLIDDLLDLSRIGLGKVELKLLRASVQSIVEDATELAGPAIEAGHHQLKLKMPDVEIPVVADSTRMVQALGNLLSNAAKFTPEGGHITVEVSTDGENANICIIDDGVGIPPHMMARIFEKFIQIDAAIDRPNDGLGIGLSIAKQIVELHGGTIRATSDGANLGCTFTVRLPLATTEETSVVVHAIGATDDERIEDSRRILVVDDNVEAARSLQTVLELMGHESLCVYNASNALEAIDECVPDVIFLDIGLPDMSGYELAGSIRRNPASTGVVLVALTGWGSDEHRRRSVAAGFDYHLAKPANVATIRQILSTIVRTSIP